MSLAELKAKRAEAIAKAEAITETAVKEGRDLSETEAKSFEEYDAAIKSADANIARLEKLQAHKAAAAQVVLPPPGSPGADEDALERAGKGQTLPAEAAQRDVAQKMSADEKVDSIVGIMVALAKGGGTAYGADRFLEAQEKAGNQYAAMTRKALNTTTATAGGVLTPTNLSSDLFELLRPKSVVRGAGPRFLTLQNGNETFPVMTTGAISGYVGEGGEIQATEQTFGQKSIQGRKLAALVAMTKEFLRRSEFSADAMIRADLIQSLAQTSDMAFLLGDGTSNTPIGLAAQANPANVLTANATVDIDTITRDLMRLVNAVQVKNVPQEGLCYFMNTAVRNYLMTVNNALGLPAFRSELEKGMLNGYPVKTTTQIPTNYGGNKSKIIFAAMGDVILAEEGTLEIEVSNQASINVGGAQFNAFQRDSVIMKATASNNILARHAEAVAVLNDVTWVLS